jgi:hypothetical protein
MPRSRLASSMHGVLWFYRAPNLVLKNSKELLVLNQTTAPHRARSLRCEQPYEPNPRWCSVAVCCPCGGRQCGNGYQPCLGLPHKRESPTTGYRSRSAGSCNQLSRVPSTMARRPADKLVPRSGTGKAARMPLSKNLKMVTLPWLAMS